MSEIDVFVEIKVVTDKAILVEAGIGDPVWIPRSQINDYENETNELKPGLTATIYIAEWLATQKGLI